MTKTDHCCQILQHMRRSPWLSSQPLYNLLLSSTTLFLASSLSFSDSYSLVLGSLCNFFDLHDLRWYLPNIRDQSQTNSNFLRLLTKIRPISETVVEKHQFSETSHNRHSCTLEKCDNQENEIFEKCSSVSSWLSTQNLQQFWFKEPPTSQCTGSSALTL